MDDDATGQRSESGPNASLAISVDTDGPARIANYVDWLGHCGSYQVTNYNQDGSIKNKRIVNTVVEGRAVNGPGASVTVTRTFTTPGGRTAPMTYHVSYYAVRGVLLECSIYGMNGADTDLVQRRAAKHCKGCVRYEHRSTQLAMALVDRGRLVRHHDRCGADRRAHPKLAQRRAAHPGPARPADWLRQSDQQLADLLPKRAEFPASWTVKDEHESDSFGYYRSQPFHLTVLVPSPPNARTWTSSRWVSATPPRSPDCNPADPPDSPLRHPRSIRLSIAREFNRGGFDAMIDLVARCSRFTSGGVLIYTVRVLEDSRPANAPQRFRIVETQAAASGNPRVARTEYFSFARTSALILTGYARNDDQQLLDTLFDSTLRRIGAPD